MDKILILYKSKYGATEKYACMLKEILECEILKTEHYNKAVLGLLRLYRLRRRHLRQRYFRP